MKTTDSTRTITGLIIVAVGLGFLLDAVGLIGFSDLLAKFWPVFIILAGVLALKDSPRSPLWPAILIGFGSLLLLRQTDVIDFNVWKLIWPAIIIAIGFNIIFEKMNHKPRVATDTDQDLSAILSGNSSRNTSDNYKGGKLTAILGGIELDLNKATIEKEAYLDAFCFMGGVELRVPDTWEVRTSGTPILGGWDNKAVKPQAKNPPVLHVRGTCIMGGLNIKN